MVINEFVLKIRCYACDDEVFVDESSYFQNLRDCLTLLQGGDVVERKKEQPANGSGKHLSDSFSFSNQSNIVPPHRK